MLFFDSDLKCYGILLTMDVTFDDAEQEENQKTDWRTDGKDFPTGRRTFTILRCMGRGGGVDD